MGGFPSGSAVRNLPAMQEMRVRSRAQEDPWGREWLPTPVFLLGESHGQRSLGGCSPRDHKELDSTEVTEQGTTCTSPLGEDG